MNMKTLNVIFVISAIIVMFALIAYFAVSCFGVAKGNGNIIKQTYEVLSFKSIEISGTYDVILNQSDKESVSVVADENIINFIKVESKNNVLTISTKRNLKTKSNVQVFIDFIDVNSIESSGVSNIISDSIIKANNFEIELDGAGTANLNIEVSKLEVDIKGAGIVEISGNVDFNDIDISGAGIFKGHNLITRKTEIEISGASKAYVNASDILDVEITGASEVKYAGNPAVKQKISGVGVLIKE